MTAFFGVFLFRSPREVAFMLICFGFFCFILTFSCALEIIVKFVTILEFFFNLTTIDPMILRTKQTCYVLSALSWMHALHIQKGT